MTRIALSRRHLLGAGAVLVTGAVSLPRAASADPGIELDATRERVIRKYYAAWEQKDWGPFDIVLADNFTLTSPNNDDHISSESSVFAVSDQSPRFQRGSGCHQCLTYSVQARYAHVYLGELSIGKITASTRDILVRGGPRRCTLIPEHTSFRSINELDWYSNVWNLSLSKLHRLIESLRAFPETTSTRSGPRENSP